MNFFSNFQITDSIHPGIVTETQTGIGVDTTDFNLTSFNFFVGASGDPLSSEASIECSLEESNNSTDGENGDWTAVDPEDLLDSTLALIDSGSEDDVFQVAEYKPQKTAGKTWVRPVITLTADAFEVGVFVSCEAIQGFRRSYQ